MPSIRCWGHINKPEAPQLINQQIILEIKVVVSSPRNGGLTKEDNLVSSTHGVEYRRQEDL